MMIEKKKLEDTMMYAMNNFGIARKKA